MPNSQRGFLLYCLLCALAASLLLWPGRGGGFLLDDESTITDNRAVQITTLDAGSLAQAAYSYSAGGGTRPLPMLSFALDYWRAGPDAAAFKTTNLVVHALTALALASFFRLLLPLAGWTPQRTVWAAPALAFAWAIHPLQVSSVLYVVQRMQTMATLFVVLALWAYLKMRCAQINGQRSRLYAILSGLAWVLAMASKEDSILLPAYALAMELTVLGFRAAQPRVAQGLRRGYLVATVVGAAVLLAVLSRYWSPGPYPYRDFSSSERLLTQGRVLAMYLGQILLPLPGRLPFYYDWLQPSRGLLQPASTLPSLLLVAGLLATAWHLRTRRPLFALGTLLFFIGHLVTSNALNLELAFEHRNHFPLIGAVLAVGDLLALAAASAHMRPRVAAAGGAVLLVLLAAATAVRVQAWRSPLAFAAQSTLDAPTSERAWSNLCRIHFEASGSNPGHTEFDAAVNACRTGAELGYGASTMASLIVLKTIRGDATPADWNALYARMRLVTMTPSNLGVAWYLVRYSNGDSRVDARRVVPVLDIVTRRTPFRPDEYAVFGYYAAKHGLDADAYRYFEQAVRHSPLGNPVPAALVADLRAEGRPDWANRLEALARSTPTQP